MDRQRRPPWQWMTETTSGAKPYLMFVTVGALSLESLPLLQQIESVEKKQTLQQVLRDNVTHLPCRRSVFEWLCTWLTKKQTDQLLIQCICQSSSMNKIVSDLQAMDIQNINASVFACMPVDELKKHLQILLCASVRAKNSTLLHWCFDQNIIPKQTPSEDNSLMNSQGTCTHVGSVSVLQCLQKNNMMHVLNCSGVVKNAMKQNNWGIPRWLFEQNYLTKSDANKINKRMPYEYKTCNWLGPPRVCSV